MGRLEKWETWEKWENEKNPIHCGIARYGYGINKFSD